MQHSYDFYRIKQILKGFKNAQTWKLFLVRHLYKKKKFFLKSLRVYPDFCICASAKLQVGINSLYRAKAL